MKLIKNKKWFLIFIILLCFLIVLTSILYFSGRFSPSENIPSGVSDVSSEVILRDNPIDFVSQIEQNPDVHAWIYIPNTNINYPVLQSNDVSDLYYMDHSFEKKYSSSGAIFTQSMNSKNFTDPVTVIYGHNMRNGSMFRTLHYFNDEEFFNNNSLIYIYLPNHILTYEIFSAFEYNDRHLLNTFDFSKEEDFNEFVNDALNPKRLYSKVRETSEIKYGERLVVLSTCMSGVKSSYRYLVVGRLISDEITK